MEPLLSLSLALPLAAILDAAVGDPQGWPHPVRAIGRLIAATESLLRLVLGPWADRPSLMRGAGVALAVAVVAVTCGATAAILAALRHAGPLLSLCGNALIIYWGLAARGLGREALRAATAEDLSVARQRLSMIVGRDTEALDRPEVCRACVETVAENANDAVVAPLFWFAIGGPVALWGYKAVSTLDSMVGYRNDRYRDMGWASARLDDVAALIPARLTWLLLSAASAVCGERPRAAFWTGWRDGLNHPSPNAAWGEATVAGALGVQLGGPATYGGRPSNKPHLGDPGHPIGPETVARAVRLMHVAAGLAVVLAWAVRTLVDAGIR